MYFVIKGKILISYFCFWGFAEIIIRKEGKIQLLSWKKKRRKVFILKDELPREERSIFILKTNGWETLRRWCHKGTLSWEFCYIVWEMAPQKTEKRVFRRGRFPLTALQMEGPVRIQYKCKIRLCLPRNETAQPSYFQNIIIMFCLSISTFMYLWAIYIFPGWVCLFTAAK